MPVPRYKSNASRFCSFQAQLNRDCDVVHPPESVVDLGDEPFVVGWPVTSTMAKTNSTRERKSAGATLKSNAHVVGNDSNEKTHIFSTGI